MIQSLSLRKYRLPAMHLITLLVTGLGLLFCLAMNGLQLKDQILWQSYFDGTIPIGNQCEIAVLPLSSLPLNEIRSSAAAAGLKSMKMPHRGQAEAPVVFAHQSLYTRCLVDLSAVSAKGFGWIYLGKSFGPSTVYVNEREITSTLVSSGETFEFPIPPDARGKVSVIELVSQGTPAGSSGLATLIPPFATDQPHKLNQIRRSLTTTDREQELLLSVSTFILLIFFCGLWLFGLRFDDLFWMNAFCGALCLIHSQKFFRQFDEYWLQASVPRINSLLYVVAVFAQVMFLASFTRDRRLTKSIFNLFILPTTLLATAAVTVSDELFLEWKMVVLLPTIYAQLMLLYLAGQLAVILSKSESPLLISRTKKSFVLCLAAGTILFTQSLLDHRYGIYIDSVAQAITLASFGFMMLWDLLRRQADYFEEKSVRLVKEQQLSESRAVSRTVKYLAHDLLKPFGLLKLFSEGFAYQSPADLPVYCQKFQDSLIKTHSDAEAMMHELLSSQEHHTAPVGTRSLANLKQEIASSTLTIQPILEMHRIAFLSDISLELSVAIDPVTLRRILNNLYDNAIKAMIAAKQDDLRLEVRAQKNNDLATISVFNSKTFVPEPLREQIFTIGDKQGDHGRFGLGLAFVRSALSAVGGNISCHSDESGTTFIMTLPTADNRTQLPEKTKTPIVCVVDDDEFVLLQWNQFALRHPLEMRVDTFRSPEDILERCRNFPDYLGTVDKLLLDEFFSGSKILGSEIVQELKAVPGCPKIFTTSELMKTGSSVPYCVKTPRRFPEI